MKQEIKLQFTILKTDLTDTIYQFNYDSIYLLNNKEMARVQVNIDEDIDVIISIKAIGDDTERFISYDGTYAYYDGIPDGEPHNYQIIVSSEGCEPFIYTFTKTCPVLPNPVLDCSADIQWNVPVVNCNSASPYAVYLSVTGNKGQVVEFKNPVSNTFVSANSGTNGYNLSLPNGAYWTTARIKGCENGIDGFFNVVCADAPTPLPVPSPVPVPTPVPVPVIAPTPIPPTPVPLPVPIPTPTPVPVPIPTPLPCDCHAGTITSNDPFQFTDCNGAIQSGSGEGGTEICFDVTQSSTNVTDGGLSVSCECGEDGPNPFFENNILQGLVDGDDELPNNVSGLDSFGDLQLFNTDGMRIKMSYADDMEFQEDLTYPRMIELGLADFVDNNELRTMAELPLEKRTIWNNLGNGYGYTTSGILHAYNSGILEYNAKKAERKDKNGDPILWRLTHLDLETSDWIDHPAETEAFLCGFYDTAIVDDPEHIIFHYGKMPNSSHYYKMGPYAYSAFPHADRERLLPFMDVSVNYTNNNGPDGVEARTRNIYFNILFNYPVAPLPQTLLMYNYDLSGPIYDAYGERVFKDIESASEVYRGHTQVWHNKQPSAPVDPSQGDYKNITNEAYTAVYAPFAHYTHAVFAKRMAFGNNNIVSANNNGHKFGMMLRNTFESNSWDATYRPVCKYMTKYYGYLAFIFSDIFLWWTGMTLVKGLTVGGTYPVPAEGNQFFNNQREPGDCVATSCDINLSAEQQMAALYYKCKMLYRKYGFFSSSDKLCTFTDIFLAQEKAEIMGFGLLVSNRVFLVLCEPRHDLAESMSITIGNTKNGVTYSRNLQAKKIIDEVFTFPDTDTYEPQNIWIEYTSTNGNTLKCSGDLNYHYLL